MQTSKKIFIVVSVVFFGLLVYASYDISQRTTFPGSKSQLKARIKKQLDGPATDTLQVKTAVGGDSSAVMATQPPK